ncbi:MAG TPA: hypothetical protein VKA83_09320 [Methylomirabilota bacterium]|nr:hypothetical protein [Methylomirabilota bacterium]
MTPPDSILVINAASPSVCSDDEVRHYVAAIQDFLPEFNRAWGLPEVDVAFMPHGQAIPKGFGHLQVIADDSDQAEALGYHEVAEDGFPIGYTFAKTGRAGGNSISGTLTHEIWEARVNPMIDRQVSGPDGRRWDLEVADAVEADEWGIRWPMPNGPDVLLSDFCLPGYYDFAAPWDDRGYDYRGLLKRPIPEMLPGGYLAFQEPGGRWGQVDAFGSDRRARARARPLPLSRRYRAMLRSWQTSYNP